MAKERRLKRYHDRIRNIDKSGHSKTRKKIYQQVRSRINQHLPTTGRQGNKTILEQNTGSKRT